MAILIGGCIGRYVGFKTVRKTDPNDKYLLEQLYIGYFEAIIESLEFFTRKFNKVDLNKVRLVLEMSLQKFTLAINYSNVKNSKKLIKCVVRFKKLLFQKNIQKAML